MIRNFHNARKCPKFYEKCPKFNFWPPILLVYLAPSLAWMLGEMNLMLISGPTTYFTLVKAPLLPFRPYTQLGSKNADICGPHWLIKNMGYILGFILANFQPNFPKSYVVNLKKIKLRCSNMTSPRNYDFKRQCTWGWAASQQLFYYIRPPLAWMLGEMILVLVTGPLYTWGWAASQQLFYYIRPPLA